MSSRSPNNGSVVHRCVFVQLCYLDKDALGQEASQCVCVGGWAAWQADVELW